MSAEPVDNWDPDDLAPRHDVPRGGRSGFVVIEGRQVHYLEWGHRGLPPVVCLHGGGQTAYMFEALGAALAATHHLLAPDLPSHGDSDPAEAGEWGRHVIAATIPPLCAAFGFNRAAFVGASLGGITSITVAASDPELVGAVVLIDVGHRLEEDGVRKIMDFMSAHESFASLDEAAAEIAKYLPHRREVRRESLTRNLRRRKDGRWVWKHSFGRRYREQVERGAVEGGAVEGGAVEGGAVEGGAVEGGSDWRDVLAGLDHDAAGLQCPVLVLRGSASDVLSHAGAEEVAALIPDARLATVSNAGHLAAGDNPDSTVGLIRAFLDEVHQ